jgi:hypothetical protein
VPKKKAKVASLKRPENLLKIVRKLIIPADLVI